MGGGIVEEEVTTPCNDCGDLTAALEWTAWTPCADETSEEAVEGMLCRRRGNTRIGFEEEEKDCWTQIFAHPTELALMKNNLLTTIPSLTKEWVV